MRDDASTVAVATPDRPADVEEMATGTVPVPPVAEAAKEMNTPTPGVTKISAVTPSEPSVAHLPSVGVHSPDIKEKRKEQLGEEKDKVGGEPIAEQGMDENDVGDESAHGEACDSQSKRGLTSRRGGRVGVSSPGRGGAGVGMSTRAKGATGILQYDSYGSVDYETTPPNKQEPRIVTDPMSLRRKRARDRALLEASHSSPSQSGDTVPSLHSASSYSYDGGGGGPTHDSPALNDEKMAAPAVSPRRSLRSSCNTRKVSETLNEETEKTQHKEPGPESTLQCDTRPGGKPETITCNTGAELTTSPLYPAETEKAAQAKSTKTEAQTEEVPHSSRSRNVTFSPSPPPDAVASDKRKTPVRSPTGGQKFQNLPSIHDAKLTSPCGSLLSPYSPSTYGMLSEMPSFDRVSQTDEAGADSEVAKSSEEGDKSLTRRDEERLRAVATPTDFSVDFGKDKPSPNFDASNVLAWLQSPTAQGLFSPGPSLNTPKGYGSLGGPRTPRTPTVGTSFFFQDVAGLPRIGELLSPRRDNKGGPYSSMICISPLASSKARGGSRPSSDRASRTNTPMSNYKDVFESPYLSMSRSAQSGSGKQGKPRSVPLLSENSPARSTKPRGSQRRSGDPGLDVHMAERDLMQDEDLSVLLQLASSSGSNTGPNGSGGGSQVFRSPQGKASRQQMRHYGRDGRSSGSSMPSLQFPVMREGTRGNNHDDFAPPPLTIRSSSSGGSKEIFLTGHNSYGSDDEGPERRERDKSKKGPDAHDRPTKGGSSEKRSQGDKRQKATVESGVGKGSSSSKTKSVKLGVVGGGGYTMGSSMPYPGMHYPPPPPSMHHPHPGGPASSSPSGRDGGKARSPHRPPPPYPPMPVPSHKPGHMPSKDGSYRGMPPYPHQHMYGHHPQHVPPPYSAYHTPYPHHPSHRPPHPHMPVYSQHQQPTSKPAPGAKSSSAPTKKAKTAKTPKPAAKRPAASGTNLKTAPKKPRKGSPKTVSSKKKPKGTAGGSGDPAERQKAAAAIAAVNAASGGQNDRAAALAAAILRGVTMRPSGKWQAQLYYAGKSRYIGVFDTREKAALAYEIAREKLKSDNKTPADQSAQTLKATEDAVNNARKAAFEGVNEKDPRPSPAPPTQD